MNNIYTVVSVIYRSLVFGGAVCDDAFANSSYAKRKRGIA